ncbi:MAG: 7-carboxy-7-deazaguanine synthase QueE, partial [Pseudohongiellaceae bacterium]
PGSLEESRNHEQNYAALKPKDQVKFVICDRNDYEFAKSRIQMLNLTERVGEVLLSPSYTQLPAQQLAAWILQDGMDVRMQLQMHKLIWGDAPGH